MQKQTLYYDMTFEEFYNLLKELEKDLNEILMVSLSGHEKIGSKLEDLRFTVQVKNL